MSLKVLSGLDSIIERLSGSVKRGLVIATSAAILATNGTCITTMSPRQQLEQQLTHAGDSSEETWNRIETTATLLSYAKQRLQLDKVNPEHIKHASTLADNNGLALLQYSHDNIGLRTVKSEQLADFAWLAQNGGTSLVRYLHEEMKLGDPSNIIYHPDEEDIEVLIRLVKNDGLSVLKFAQKDLGINRITITDLHQIAEISEDPELRESLLDDGPDLYQTSRECFGMWHIKGYQLKRFAEIAKNDGAKIVEFAHNALDLATREPYDFDRTEFSFLHKVATSDGLNFLKYANAELGLDWITSFMDIAMIVDDEESRSALKTEGKQIYDYAHTQLALEGTTGRGLNSIATLALSNGIDILRYVNTELNLQYITNSGMDYLATMNDMGGIEFLRYLHEDMGLTNIKNVDFGELVGIMMNGRIKSTRQLESGISDPDGLNFLKHLHEDLGIEKLDQRHIDALASLSAGDYPDIIDEVHDKVGTVKDVWDLMNLSNRVGLLTDTNIMLYKERGIVHFERYTPDIINETTKTLDPKYRADAPIALLIHNKNDRDGAFTNAAYISEVANLIGHYRLLVFETENEYGAYDAIRTVTKEHGTIDILMLGGHGTAKTLNLGVHGEITGLDTVPQISQVDDAYIDITDTRELSALESSLSPDAQVVLISCSTGKGKKKGKNVANMLGTAFPGRTIYSPAVDSHLNQFVLDDTGKLIDVKYQFPSGELLDDTETYIIKKE